MPFSPPEHLGRSHHTAVDAAISIIGGFAASFLTFSITAYSEYSSSMRGQLIAGDPTLNRQYPTTLSMMQSGIDGTNPILQSMSSYGWWMAVLIGAIVAAFIIFRLIRRYV